MAFIFHHSLVSRAAVSVVVSLWYHEDIDSLKIIDEIDGVNDCYEDPFDGSECKYDSAKRIHRLALQKSVRDNASKLSIPESLKRYLQEFVQVVGENIENWVEDHYRPTEKITESVGSQCNTDGLFDTELLFRNTRIRRCSVSRVNSVIDVDLRKVLRWNPDGGLDLEQTGEALVRNENDSVKRFRLACAYCKDGEMLRLWPSVRDHFSNIEAWDTNRAYEVSALFWWRYFKSFWPEPVAAYLFKLETVKSEDGVPLIVHDLHMSCFHTFRNLHSPLTIYLLNHIDSVDEEFWYIIKGCKNITDKRFGAIFFRMPNSYHVKLLSKHPGDYFKLLLLWRHQSFFTDAVERSWDLFGEYLFDDILFHIARGVERYPDSDIYRLIFLRYWTGSPARLKDVERILYDWKVEEDGRTLRQYVAVLFGHSPAAEKKMKGLMHGGQHVLELMVHVLELMVNDRARDVLSELVRTCLPSEEWEEKLKLIN